MAAYLNPSTILCKYFAAGKCKRSDCFYSHDALSQPANVCRYFQLGICFYGDECRFEHIPVVYSEDEEMDFSQPLTSVVVITEPPTREFLQPQRESKSSRMTNPNSSKTTKLATRNSEHGHKNQKKFWKKPRDVEPEGPVDVLMPNVSKVKTLPPLCPIGMEKVCNLIDCPFRHGDYCDICQCHALDPEDADQRSNHQKMCVIKFEEEMETSFAVKRNQELQCNVCLDIVLTQTDVGKRRFGIMQGCKHVFCFSCIMSWRKQQAAEPEDVKRNRSCPTCRVHSHYVFPWKFFPETDGEKEKIIDDFKKAMAKKSCHTYDHGKGKCLFGNQCWYLHTTEDGTVVQLPAPRTGRYFRTGMMEDDMDDFFEMSDESDVDSYLELDNDDQLYADMMEFADQLASADLHDLYGVPGMGPRAAITEDGNS